MGMGKFKIAAMSTEQVMTGSIAAGSAQLAGTKFEVSLALVPDSAPLVLALIAPSMAATVSADAFTAAKICGAITKNELDTVVLPAVTELLNGLVQEGGNGGSIICGLFDLKDANDFMSKCPGETKVDCAADCSVAMNMSPPNCISLCEVQSNSLLKSILAPDVMLTDPDSGMMTEALSLGVGIEAKKASY
jgi:hypothetical protein